MKKETNRKVEEILDSLNGVKRISTPDFFYTRLKARLDKGMEPRRSANPVLRPAYAIGILALIITFNVISLIKHDKTAMPTASAPSDSENTQSIASAYQLDDNSVYDLNLEK